MGKRGKRCNINPEDYAKIREEYKSDLNMTHAKLAENYTCSASTICRILKETSDQSKDEQLSGQITQLQKQITDLMSTKTSVNNNNNVVVNNLPPLTDENIAKHVDRLSLDFILQGAKGYADFANRYPFKNHIICTDRSRKKIKYRNADGELVDDPYGRRLTQRFFKTVADKNRQLINDEYKQLQTQVKKIADSNTEATNLTSILSKVTLLQDILQSCNEAAEGKDNKFTQEFINHLTKII